MNTVIKVENLSKAYQIGQIGTGTISRDIERWFVTRILRREDPFLRLGQINDRTKKDETNVVWSLLNVDLEIKRGDAVGIIGRNGAGKSTLLKLLSRITSPTTGRIKMKGRVASLLEVGTGFHPELTGRENVYLNGSILGMRKSEIDRKLDEIVDFSGIERYIDTPVKRYSSGMSVRLAFAVAAHLESEILIVDEVLAVGDAEFQRKCLGKMEEVGHRDGRTILFVSHNMSAVRTLCNRGVLIESGRVEVNSSITDCIGEYSKRNSMVTDRGVTNNTLSSSVISGVRVNEQLVPVTAPGEGFSVRVNVQAPLGADPMIFFIISNSNGQQVIHSRVSGSDIGMAAGKGTHPLTLTVPPLWLAPGLYSVYFKILVQGKGRRESERIILEVKDGFDDGVKGLLSPNIDWSVDKAALERARLAT